MSLVNGLPKHLAGTEAMGLSHMEPIAQFEIGKGKNFVYLILDWFNRKAAIVDPQSDLSGPLGVLWSEGFSLQEVILTHTHPDHTAGLSSLMSRYPKIQVRVGEPDLHRLSEALRTDSRLCLLTDGSEFQVGDLVIRAMHTPGHSAGEYSFYLGKQGGVDLPYLFTGDTIFIRDCGRTDFEDGSDQEMFQSIQKIKTLPPETVFLVGHHYAKECATTLERERKESPPFRCQSVQELAELP